MISINSVIDYCRHLQSDLTELLMLNYNILSIRCRIFFLTVGILKLWFETVGSYLLTSILTGLPCNFLAPAIVVDHQLSVHNSGEGGDPIRLTFFSLES